MRRAARVDSNQREIVTALRKAGYQVQHLHIVSNKYPNILVGAHDNNILIELKDGNKKPSARRLTEDERQWHESWAGQVDVAHDFGECIEIILRETRQ